MKPTGNFKLSKPTKCLMALGRFADKEQRNAFKLMMIQAELAASVKLARTKERTSPA